MLKSEWTINISYNRGDIVTIYDSFENFMHYYICVISHIADDLVNPKNSEEIYWIEIKDMHPITSVPIVPTFPEYTFPPPPPQSNLSHLIIPLFNLYKKQEQEDNTDEVEPSNKLKRKLKSIEKDISCFKKKRKIEDSTLDLKEQIMLLNVDIETKIFLLEKYENIQNLSNSEYVKGKVWLKTVLNIPFGKYKPFKIKASDNSDKINEYFKMVRSHLDKKVHNMSKVKDEIMEFIARKISNPNSKGHVLALCGPPGCAKTIILKSLAEALELPFYQVNFGGLNDVSVLTGHSETYVGSKPGRFVEILASAGCMNPIIYLDEIDKISDSKGREINGILTHLLDEEQNDKFQDNYLSNININLSKALFVIAFNEHDKVDRIVSDRMKVIYIDAPTIDAKVVIASDKMIPDIINMLNIKKDKFITLDDELLKYIIESKVPKEDGVRQLRKCLEKLFNRINYLFLTGQYKESKESSLYITKSKTLHNVSSELSLSLSNIINTDVETEIETVHITKLFIDNCLDAQDKDTGYLHMYI